MVYDDYNMTYEELLASQSGIFIHQKHLKHLDFKVYKSLTNLSPEFMWPLFKNKYIRYNLRNGNICILPLNNLPISVKESVSVEEFKQKLNHVKKFLFCALNILKFLSIMSVLVFLKLVFISLVISH